MPVEDDNTAVGKDGTGSACGYDCLARNTGDVEPNTKIVVGCGRLTPSESVIEDSEEMATLYKSRITVEW
ncbi:hypothetical protein HGM15179_007365 [Zosterops borbonicus]|uniref:Uncharacterized protein n=1 Tax=Zosterops borbonicus TaxID=364589 RepID=A0A8K1GKX7_9PASS|nr:hypothetical protein HGM15179_007365 [Zosterops borbonicus]